ncbi:ABC transporter permease subunit [Bacteriovoracaceae bacterium]|nr:ABC transporter permease subunit [Bacteriovoracaceae bacterium]
MLNYLNVSFYTFKQILKSRILLVSFILSIAVVVSTYIAAEFTYLTQIRVIIDVGLGFMNLLSVGVAIFLGVNLISDEIENRTLYFMLSKPVSRKSFLFGKISGMVLILLSIVVITAINCNLIMYFITSTIRADFFVASFFILIEAVLMLFLVIILSLLSNKVISVIASLSIYIVGCQLVTLRTVTSIKNNEFVLNLIDMYRYLLPDFSLIDFKKYVIYSHAVPDGFFTTALFYCVALVATYGVLLAILFDNKELS